MTDETLIVAPVTITPTKPLTPTHVKGLLWTDVLVKAMGCGCSGDDLVPRLSSEAWSAMNLDDEGLAACVAQAAEEFETIDDYL